MSKGKCYMYVTFVLSYGIFQLFINSTNYFQLFT